MKRECLLCENRKKTFETFIRQKSTLLCKSTFETVLSQEENVFSVKIGKKLLRLSLDKIQLYFKCTFENVLSEKRMSSL